MDNTIKRVIHIIIGTILFIIQKIEVIIIIAVY
jgi:hypothetical protein